MRTTNGHTHRSPTRRRSSRLLLAAVLTAAPPLGDAARAGTLAGTAEEMWPVTAGAAATPDLARLGGPVALAGQGAVLALLDVAPWPARAAGASVRGADAEPAAYNPAPIVSGLTWRSGASCADRGFAKWRGRKLDEVDFGANHPTWDAWIANLQTPAFKASITLAPQPVIAMAMFPKSEFKRFAACASGKFDGYLNRIGAILKAEGATRAIFRLGWEANIGSHSHPWGVDTADDAKGYQKCFRHEVTLLRKALPGAMFEWTNATVSHTPGPTTMTYPGDGYTDLWGLHYYDAGARFGTEALWDAYYDSTYMGGPQGMGTWLKAAAAHGKKLAVPEWGVRQPLGTDPALADDPFYIGKMFQTFSSHASEIAYENYFNCPTTSRIYPDTLFPKAAAEYRRLWSAGP